MTDDKLHRDIVRGGRAAELLNSELLQETFASLEAQYIAAWQVTALQDTAGRERLWQAVNLVRKVQDHLKKIAADGRLSQAHLDQLVKADKAKKQR